MRTPALEPHSWLCDLGLITYPLWASESQAMMAVTVVPPHCCGEGLKETMAAILQGWKLLLGPRAW